MSIRELNFQEVAAVSGGWKLWVVETEKTNVNLDDDSKRSTLSSSPRSEPRSICISAQIGPVTVNRCLNQDGSVTVTSCVTAGPNVNVGGVGVGVSASVCTVKVLSGPTK